MCLIVTLIMLGVAIQSFLQYQWMAGGVQLIIALGFMLLLIRNILAVRDHKHECSSTGCRSTDWLTNTFQRKEQ